MSAYITNELFSDFTDCHYKAYLRFSGASGENSEFEDSERELSRDYHVRARQHLLQRHPGSSVLGTSVPLSSVLSERYAAVADVSIRQGDIDVHVDALLADPRTDSARKSTYLPVMFVHEEKLTRNRKLLLAFCASAVAAHQGSKPPFGRILHGATFKNSKVQLDRLWGEVDEIVAEMRALRDATEPPTLCLNPHCGTCEFRQRCHAAAVEKDDLSLLQGIKAKEIAKLNSRGIFTVIAAKITHPRDACGGVLSDEDNTI